MSLKDLKGLKDQCDQEKERLKEKTRINKDLRAEIRSIQNTIKAREHEIGSLDSKGTTGGKMINERSTLTSEELETFSSVFTKITSEHLFDSFVSKAEDNIKKEKKQNVVSIDVEFERVRISFFVNHSTSFKDLRKQVASYWSLPLDEIFFSDQSPDEGLQAVFLLDNNIIDELYKWNRIKLKDHNFLLYLVLRNYTSLQERMNQIFPKSITKESQDSDTEEAHQNLISNRKKKEIKTETISEKVLKRKKWYICQVILQSLLYVTLFLLWVFLLGTEMNTQQATWVNQEVTRNFLWEFGFNDEEIGSVYGTDQASPIMSIIDRATLWDYISSIQNLTSNIERQGILGTAIYPFRYIELRQLRTKNETKEDPYIGNYTSTVEYKWYSTSDKSSLGSGEENYEKYTSRSAGVFVYGNLAVYPLSGFINNLDIYSTTADWATNISTLQNMEWINDGTRAVFITMNFLNPTSKIITILMPYIEITASGIYIPNFKIYSVQNSFFSTERSLIHAFILIIAILLFIIEIIDNIRLPEEIHAYSIRRGGLKESNYEDLHDKIIKHHAKNFFKRFHRPRAVEIVSFFTLFCVITIEIAGYSWYAAKFKTHVQYTEGYANFYGTFQGFAMLNDVRTIITLLLAINIIRYFIIWMSEISQMFKVVKYAFTQYVFYIILCWLPILFFSVHYYYFLGPFTNVFNTLEHSYVSVIRIFTGQWPTNSNFLSFVDSGYLVLLHFCFIIWKMIVLNFQIIIFQMRLSKNRIIAPQS